MPTYDYECLKCNYAFETFQKINDPVLKECPKCKGQLKRLIGAGSGLIFKGSGFYANDYKKRPAPVKSQKDSVSKADSPCKECPQASCDRKEK